MINLLFLFLVDFHYFQTERDNEEKRERERKRESFKIDPIAQAKNDEAIAILVAARIKRQEEERKIEDIEERRIMNEIRNQYTNRK